MSRRTPEFIYGAAVPILVALLSSSVASAQSPLDFDTAYYYRLHPSYSQLDSSLAVNTKTRRLYMAPSAGTSTQRWRLAKLGLKKGKYKLYSEALGDAYALDVINDGRNNRVHLAPAGNFTGQAWTISTGPRITQQLHNDFTGSRVRLAHNVDSTRVGLVRRTRPGGFSRSWVFRRDAPIDPGAHEAYAAQAAGHQRELRRRPNRTDPLTEYDPVVPLTERMAPYPDGAWYLWLHDDHGQKSRMTFNIENETFEFANRRMNVELINVRTEDLARVKFKLVADKRLRRDGGRSNYFSHWTTGIRVDNRGGRVRGFYIADIQGMSRREFEERNPNAVIRITPVPPLADVSESARSRLGLLPGEIPETAGGPNKVYLHRQQIWEGWVPYVGGIGPLPGQQLTSLYNPGLRTLGLVKAGRSTDECHDPSASVLLPPNGELSASQMEELYGGAQVSLDRRVPVVACMEGTSTAPPSLYELHRK